MNPAAYSNRNSGGGNLIFAMGPGISLFREENPAGGLAPLGLGKKTLNFA